MAGARGGRKKRRWRRPARGTARGTPGRPRRSRGRCRGRRRRGCARAARRASPSPRPSPRPRRPARPSSRHGRRRSRRPSDRRTAPARSRRPARPARRPAGRSPARRPWRARRGPALGRRRSARRSMDLVHGQQIGLAEAERGRRAAAVLAHIVGLVARAVAAVERRVEARADAAVAGEEAMLHAGESASVRAWIMSFRGASVSKSRPARRFCRRHGQDAEQGAHLVGRDQARQRRVDRRALAVAGARLKASARCGDAEPPQEVALADRAEGRPRRLRPRARAAKSTWAVRSVSPGRRGCRRRDGRARPAASRRAARVVAVVDDQRRAAVARQTRADRARRARGRPRRSRPARRPAPRAARRRTASTPGASAKPQRLAVAPGRPCARASRAPCVRTGGPAGRRRTRWRPAAAGPSGTSSKRSCQVGAKPRERGCCCSARRRALISTRCSSSAAWKPGTPRVARSASAISVPRPGPSSTSAHGGGRAHRQPALGQPGADQLAEHLADLRRGGEVAGGAERQGACGSSRGAGWPSASAMKSATVIGPVSAMRRAISRPSSAGHSGRHDTAGRP